MVMDLVARTQSMTSHPDGTETQVKVTGPSAVPDGAKRLRARARGLISSGVLPTGRDSVEKLTAGEVQNLTYIEGEPVVESTGRLTERRLYTVVVTREQC